MSEHTPKHGLRVLLDRLDGEPGRARYRVELYVPAVSHATEATLADGAVTFGEWSLLEGAGAPEAWTIDAAKAFLRTLQKNHAADGDWPVRIMRWRDRK